MTALTARVRARVAVVPSVRLLSLELKLLAVGLAVIAALLVLALLSLVFVGSGAAGTAQGEGVTISCRPSIEGAARIPARFLPIYERASARFGLGDRGVWVLASVHQVETGFGDGERISSAGALGPMQFMPGTWSKAHAGQTPNRIVVAPTSDDHQGYATDGDEDGMADSNNVHDAVHAAARYLRANGAPGEWERAVFAYNHADWYVRKVLDGADVLTGHCDGAPEELGELPAGRLERMKHVAAWIEAQRIHYCWGGGHAPAPGPSPSFSYCWRPGASTRTYGATEKGLDCSGSVRWLLVLSGYPDPGPIHSSRFASAYPSGPGKRVTIWSNNGHVFITIDGRDWGTTSSNYAHGPAYNPQGKSGFVASHPEGL